MSIIICAIVFLRNLVIAVLRISNRMAINNGEIETFVELKSMKSKTFLEFPLMDICTEHN